MAIEQTIKQLYENSIVKRAQEREAVAKKNSDTAKKHYDNHVKDIHGLLKEIGEGMHKMGPKDGEQTHWGHVGTASSIHSSLRDLRDSVHGIGGYNPTEY